MTALNPNGTTAAVIVTHRRVDLLKHSLEQVVNQTHPVDWVIVVDNGAQQEVQELLDDLAADRAVYLPSKTNLGGAGGFAYGFLHALALGADAIWCADDDGRPKDEHVLKELYRVAVKHQLAEVSPVVANIDDPEKLASILEWAILHPEKLAAMRADCRKLYEKHYSKQSFADTLTAAVKDLTEQH